MVVASVVDAVAIGLGLTVVLLPLRKRLRG